jgi:hypothetical protein
MFAEERGSNGKRGRVLGHAYLAEDAYLEIHEVVVVQDSHVHREEYGYFLVIEGVEIWGYERDPTHDPPVHRHTFGHSERIDSDPVSFKEVAALAWQELSRRESAR